MIVFASLLAPAVSRAEVIEEIVAWVNGEIITKSDLEREEQMMISEAYKRFTGEELDRYVDEVRRGLLQRMIDVSADRIDGIQMNLSGLGPGFDTVETIEDAEVIEETSAEPPQDSPRRDLMG